jgi:hypothetical protein
VLLSVVPTQLIFYFCSFLPLRAHNPSAFLVRAPAAIRPDGPGDTAHLFLNRLAAIKDAINSRKVYGIHIPALVRMLYDERRFAGHHRSSQCA